MVGAALCWSLLGILGKHAQNAGVGPVEIGLWRAIIAGTLFFGHALATKTPLPRGRDAVAIGAFGLIGVSLFYWSYQVAVRAGGASLAAVLLYTAPAFVAVLSWLLLRERLARFDALAVIACVAGIALISIGGGTGIDVTAVSLSAGLTAGASYALYYLVGRYFFQRYEPPAVFAIMMPVGALGLLPFSSAHPTNPGAWIAVAGLGIIATYIAYLLHGAGLKGMPATKASVIACVEPVAAAALAALFFGERPGLAALIGAAIVICAAVALGRRPKSSEPSSGPTPAGSPSVNPEADNR